MGKTNSPRHPLVHSLPTMEEMGKNISQMTSYSLALAIMAYGGDSAVCLPAMGIFRADGVRTHLGDFRRQKILRCPRLVLKRRRGE